LLVQLLKESPDKFVIKEMKKNKDPHLAVGIIAKDRPNQYPGVLDADNGLLLML